MSQTADLGHNRTGVASSEGRAKAMQKDMERYAPTSRGNPFAADAVRVAYAQEGHTVGSVPPPKSLMGKAKKALEAASGDQPTLLMDKLGERLAFERTGTRLYQALVSKHEAFGSFDGGPTRGDLVRILNEEHRHFSMLTELIEAEGGDPTAMTPSANLAGTAASGVLKVITDPRTTLLQSLEAIIVAELTDREGWSALVGLAQEAGKQELAERFVAAERTEQRHVKQVRSWLAAGQHRTEG